MNLAGISRIDPAAHALDALALAGASGLVALTLGIGAPDTPPATRLLMVVALPALLSPLFGTGVTSTLHTLLARLAGWALASALLATIVALVAGGLPLKGTAAPLLVAGGIVVIAQLAVVTGARLLRIGGVTVADEWARWLVSGVLWLAAAAPLWLGPLADLGAHAGPADANRIVAASPLVHLGVAAGQDVLRTQWFYAHTSFGALQFEYPPLAGIAIAYTCLAAVLAALACALSRRDGASHTLVPEPLPTQEPAR